MQFMTAIGYTFAAWFLRPFMRLIRYRVVPEQPLEALGLDPSKPICYVLPRRSWIDWFALVRMCHELHLPKPHRNRGRLPSVDRAGCFYLTVLLETRLRPTGLSAPAQAAAMARDYDVQLVPVSIFWGRHPEQETSLLKLIFADSAQAGAFRKLLIMLINGRNVLARFGQPLSYRAYADQLSETVGSDGAGAVRRRLGRALHFHFLHVRTATLGPTLAPRATVVRDVLSAVSVRAAIEAEAHNKGLPLKKTQQRARKLVNEIAADYSTGVLRVLEHVLTWIWHRVFDGVEVNGLERIRDLAQSHEILYLPSHRSHADYLLLSYVLYRAGLVPPHIAAGINLNFWPVGGILRRGGAFYIRRKFSGDKLYAAVFRAYVDGLIRRGYPISFYPEGGRSRTGRLLQPKTGMMAMVVDSALRQRARKVAVVPVFVGYDKVWEVGSYFKELSGEAKKQESAEALLKAGKILGKSYGRVYVSFGEPQILQDCADQHLPDWRERFAVEHPEQPPEFTDFIRQLTLDHMRRINRAAAVSPVSLCACALLATPRNAAAEDELIEQFGHLLGLLDAWPYREELLVPDGDAKALLETALPVARIRRLEHSWGDILAAVGRDAVLLTYNRNNVQHLFALPALIASLFRARRSLSRDTVITVCRAVYPFLRSEFFLPWDEADSEGIIKSCIELMIQRGLLEQADDGHLRCPEVTTPTFGALTSLAGVVTETLERHAMAVLVLSREQADGLPLQRQRFEDDCRQLAERLAILTGREAPEFFDKQLFRVYLNTLIGIGLARENEDGGLEVDARVNRISERSLELLSDETRQTLLHLLSRRTPAHTSDDSSL